jgi:ABC-type transport system substrate-binding protein
MFRLNWKFGFWILFLICNLSFGIYSLAEAKEYDGLWFMGFNLHKDIFSDARVRQAVNYAIDRKYIAQRIMSEEVVPSGVIPPNMSGYDPQLKGYDYDVARAKKLLKAARYSGGKLTLLHTDGVKTISIAKRIKKDLAMVGLEVSLKQMDYSDQEKWQKELESGRHHLFLMGYKITEMDKILIGDKLTKYFHVVGCEGIPSSDNQIIFGTYEEATAAGYIPDPVCKPQSSVKTDTYDLLNPLFRIQGSANFTFYSNDRVDALLDQILQIDPSLTRVRAVKYMEINRILQKDAPTVNLFYISKL